MKTLPVPHLSYKLGANVNPLTRKATFSIWAPSAKSVILELFKDGFTKSVYQSHELTLDSKTGVWSIVLPFEKDIFYEYKIESSRGVKNCLDPYAKSMAAYCNDGTSGRAALIDLNQAKPYKISLDSDVGKITPQEKDKSKTVIYEISVRDATITKNGGGTYLDFINKLKYIKDLGVTHIQLMPVQNFYNNNETIKDFEDAGTVHNNNYNWGYDPVKTWQVSGEYDFRAYWPASANVMGTASAQNLALEYNMLLENHDMMVAWLHCPTRNGGNPVDLNFHHTLAAVAVTFQSPDTEYEYRLKNLFFTSLNYIGALPYNLTDDTQDVTSSWVYAEGSRGYVDTENIMASERLREWSSAQGRVIPVSAQDYPLEFDLMLPQSLKVPQGVASPSITFTVQMKNSSQQEDITMTVSLPSTNSAGNEMIWRAGKKYIYEITVLPDKFDVVVKTTEWDEVLGSVGDIIF